MTKTRLLTSEHVCELAGITYRQLDYWVRHEWITTDKPVRGSGAGEENVRRFTPEEATRIALMAQLVKAGIGPPAAARLTVTGEYDDAGIFRSRLWAHVYVEVYP